MIYAALISRLRRLSTMRCLLWAVIGLMAWTAPAWADTYTVTSNADDGSAGTLRWAITQANADAGSTIHIDGGLGITLTSALPMITSAVTINGGAGVSVSGANAYRILFVNTTTSTAAVSINNVSLINGSATGGAGGLGGGGGGLGAGGAIFVNSGAVTVSGVTFSNNSATGGAGGDGGGGIFTYDGEYHVVDGPTNGGGGGLGGAGSAVANNAGGNGGGYGVGDTGASGGAGYTPAANGGDFEGGGGNGPRTIAGSGGFGGGGGAGSGSHSDPGMAGNGGFGGGGGGGLNYLTNGSGGLLGGDGGSENPSNAFEVGGGGGGGAAGGAIFVRAETGGSLTIVDGSLEAGIVVGGVAGYTQYEINYIGGTPIYSIPGTDGTAAGSAMFLDGGTTTLQITAGIQTISGSISDAAFVGGLAAQLLKTGAGTLVLTGDDNVALTINGGAVQIGEGGTTGSLSADVTNNASLIFNRSDDSTYAGNITGTGDVTVLDAGVLSFTGTNSYTGSTILKAGVLSLGSGGALGGGGTISFEGGTLQFTTGDTTDYSARFSTEAGQHYRFDINGQDVLIATPLTSAGGDLAASGTGSLILTGDNTYSGDSVITGGTLQVGNGGTTGSLAGAIILDGANLVVDRSDTLTYAQTISGTGGVKFTGGGELILAGASSYVGATTIDGGSTLQVGTAVTGSSVSALGDQTNDAVINGVLDLNGYDQGVGTLTGAGTVLNSADGTAANFTVGKASSTFSGSIADHAGGAATGIVGLTKVGAGTLTLTGANSYTGRTVLEGGVLSLGSSTAAGNGGAISFEGGTLQFSAANTTDYSVRFSTDAGQRYSLDTNGQEVTVATGLGSVGGTLTKLGGGTLVLTGENTFAGDTLIEDGTVQIGDSGTAGSIAGNIIDHGTVAFDRSGVVTFSNVISGSGGLIQNGTGTLVLSGANTYAGGTMVAAGSALRVGVAAAGADESALGSQANATMLNGELDLNGHDQGVGTLTGIGTVLNGVDGTTSTLTVGNGDGGSTFAGVIADNGGAGATGVVGLTKNGAGTLILSGASTYTGATTIHAGTLQIGDGTSGSLSSLTTVLLTASGAAFDLNGNTQSVQSLAGGAGGSVFLGGGALTVGNDNADTTFAGVISDAGGASMGIGGALTKLGSGTFLLTGDNTYAGVTTIEGGTLQLGDGGATGSVAGDIINHASLVMDRNSPFVLTAKISGTGTTTLSGGSVEVGDGGTAGSISQDVINASALIFDRSDAVIYGNTMSGSGSVTQAGTGTLILANTNTYSGGTTISAGTLQVGNGGRTGSIAGNVVDNGTLAYNRSDTVQSSATVSGSGGVIQAGAGTLGMSGLNSYTGGTTINSGGTVRVDAAPISASVSALGSQAGAADVNGTLDLNGHDQGVGELSGTGTVLNSANGTTQTLTVGNGDASSVFGGVIANNGGGAQTGVTGLTKNGTGTLVLGGANTFTGTTTISGGSVVLANYASVLSSASLVLNAKVGVTTSNGVVTGWADQSGNGNDATNASAGSATITQGTLSNGQATLAFSSGASMTSALAQSAETTIFAVVQKNGGRYFGSLIGTANSAFGVSGYAGTLILQTVRGNEGASDPNSFSTGTPTLVGLTVDSNAQANYYANGSVVGSADASDYAQLSSFGPSGPTQIGGSGLGSYWGSAAFSGNISALVVFDSDLSAYQIAEIQGYLNAEFLGGPNVAGSLSDRSAVNITASGASLDLSGNTQAVASLSGVAGSAVYLGGGSLRAGGDDSDATFAGVISDGGVNSVNSGGSFTKIGTGTETFTGDNTYSGLTTVSGGTLQLGNGGTSGAIAGNLANASHVIFNRSDSTSYNGVISGAGDIVQAGSGTLRLGAINTYTGRTTINAGTLLVDGSIASSSQTVVNRGGTLGGHGVVGNVVINDGGTISPGNSPGTLTTGDHIWNSGGSYLWQIGNATGTAGDVSGWDMIAVNGGLTIDSSPTSPFTIFLSSLNLSDLPGDAVNFDPGSNYSWTILITDGGITGFDPHTVVLDRSGFTNTASGTFSLAVDGDDLALVYAVPEPSTWALLGVGMVVVYLLRRRPFSILS